MNEYLSPEPLSIQALSINLLLAFLSSALVAYFYSRFGESLSDRHRFARLLPFLSLTTVLIISVVKASLALSLGLVGALSIVRFRTAIKDPEELLYLFLAIAIGLGMGADQRLPTLMAATIILVVLGLRRLAWPRAKTRNLYVNISVPRQDDFGGCFQTLNDVLGQHAKQIDLRRLDRLEDTLQATYLVSCDDQETLAQLMDSLSQRVPSSTFTFIDQNTLPEV